MKIDCTCKDPIHYIDIEYIDREFYFSVVTTPVYWNFWRRVKFVLGWEPVNYETVIGDVVLTEKEAAYVAKYITHNITKRKIDES